MDRRDFLKYAGLTGVTSAIALANAQSAFAQTVLTSDSVTTDAIHAPTGRSATIVIAASDSSAKSKAQADYVCDGTTDGITIQTAIDALPITGWKIVLLEGIFDASNITLDTLTGVSIEGMGDSTILRPSTDSYPVVNILNSENFKIKNMCIDCTNGGYSGVKVVTCTEFTLSGLYIIAASYGIDAQYCSDGTIENNIVDENSTGHGDDGISIDASPYMIIRGNVCKNYLTGTGSTITSGIEIANDCRYCTIANNICYDNRMGITIHAHVAQYALYAYSITGNCLTANLIAGVYIATGPSSTGTARRISIVGNVFNNNSGWGIYSTGGLEHSAIIGNVLNQCGILIGELNPGFDYDTYKGGAGTSDSLCIIGNAITKPYSTYGMGLDNVSNSVISGNTIDMDAGGDYGLYFGSACSNNNIIGNNIHDSIKDNLKIISSTNCVFLANCGYVTDNTGTATITATTRTVEVAHGLAAAPTRVLLSPTTATAGKQYYVSAKAATTFTITIDSTAEANISFDWQAVV